MKTERALELLEDFKKNGIPTDPKKKRFQFVLEYQDVLGQSSYPDIREFWKSLNDQDKANFTWVNFHTLSQDSALDIIKYTSIRDYKNAIDELNMEDELRLNHEHNEKMIDLAKREKQFQDGRKWIFKKLRSLQELVETLKRAANYHRKDCDEWHQRYMAEKEKQDRFEESARKLSILQDVLGLPRD